MLSKSPSKSVDAMLDEALDDFDKQVSESTAAVRNQEAKNQSSAADAKTDSHALLDEVMSDFAKQIPAVSQGHQPAAAVQNREAKNQSSSADEKANSNVADKKNKATTKKYYCKIIGKNNSEVKPVSYEKDHNASFAQHFAFCVDSYLKLLNGRSQKAHELARLAFMSDVHMHPKSTEILAQDANVMLMVNITAGREPGYMNSLNVFHRLPSFCIEGIMKCQTSVVEVKAPESKRIAQVSCELPKDIDEAIKNWFSGVTTYKNLRWKGITYTYKDGSQKSKVWASLGGTLLTSFSGLHHEKYELARTFWMKPLRDIGLDTAKLQAINQNGKESFHLFIDFDSIREIMFVESLKKSLALRPHFLQGPTAKPTNEKKAGATVRPQEQKTNRNLIYSCKIVDENNVDIQPKNIDVHPNATFPQYFAYCVKFYLKFLNTQREVMEKKGVAAFVESLLQHADALNILNMDVNKKVANDLRQHLSLANMPSSPPKNICHLISQLKINGVKECKITASEEKVVSEKICELPSDISEAFKKWFANSSAGLDKQKWQGVICTHDDATQKFKAWTNVEITGSGYQPIAVAKELNEIGLNTAKLDNASFISRRPCRITVDFDNIRDVISEQSLTAGSSQSSRGDFKKT